MAGEFKIKTGLLLGPQPTQSVTSIRDTSTSITSDASSLIVTGKAIYDFHSANRYWTLDGSSLVPSDETVDVQLGEINITEDGGAVSLVDMSVTSTPTAGTEESYSFDIDGSVIAKIYAEADSAGSVQNKKFISSADFEAESSVLFTGIPETYNSKALYYNATSGEISYYDVSSGGGGIATWGSITGNLEDQTDVSTAIDAKISKSGDTMTGILTLDASLMPSLDSTISIGSSTNRFKAIYADDVYISQNSLYVNDKQVISDISETITISTDSNQDLMVKTTGSGDSKVQSDNGILLNVTSVGTSKDLELKTESTSGSILLTASGSSGQLISNTKGDTRINSESEITLDSSSGVVIESQYQYMGDPNTDNSWRFYISQDASADMVFEKRVSGSWVEKGRFE